MLEKKVIEISNTLYQKHATIYADSSAVPRALKTITRREGRSGSTVTR